MKFLKKELFARIPNFCLSTYNYSGQKADKDNGVMVEEFRQRITRNLILKTKSRGEANYLGSA